MLKLVVYSCVTGAVDSLDHIASSCPVEDPDVTYILFTDTPVTSPSCIWSQRELHRTCESPRRTSRFHKLNPHLVLPPHEISCWLDGSFRINDGVDMLQFAKAVLLRHDVATYRHPQRQCIYQEMQACVRFRKDDPHLMSQQIKGYLQDGYPPYNGLAETGVMFRRNTPAARRFNELWWQELSKGSLRDQLSFNYCMWRLRMHYELLPGNRPTSKHFIHNGRLHR